MDRKTIQHFKNDPIAFLKALRYPAGRLGKIAAKFQRQRFKKLAPSLLAVARGKTPPITRFFWDSTKGSSKDTDLAAMLLWLILFSPRMLTCQVGAADKDQAGELRKAAKTLLNLNRWIADGGIEIQQWAIVNKRTETTCEIVAADVAGSHGARPDGVLILNELSHIQKKEFAQNLLDNASKVPNGLVVVATNAGYLDSWQAEWRQIAIDSKRWAFHSFAAPAPWISEEELAEAKKRNSNTRYRRLFEGDWISDRQGDAIDETDIMACVNSKLGPMDGTEQGWQFFAGVDLGISRDFSSVCVLGVHEGHSEKIETDEKIFTESGWMPKVEYKHHEGSRMIRLACTRVWRPSKKRKINLQSVENSIVHLQKQFDLQCINFDPWQATHMAQRLTRAGLNMQETVFSGKNLQKMASTVLETFNDKKIELHDNAELLTDLRRFRVVEKSYGFRLESPRTADSGHNDLGTAFMLALLAASEAAGVGDDSIAEWLSSGNMF